MVSRPYSPAAHDWQATLPLPAVFLPAVQRSHAVARGLGAKVFFSHATHSAWPSRWENLPGMHGRHDVWPLSFWWNPVGQNEQFAGLMSLVRYQPFSHALHGVPALPQRHRIAWLCVQQFGNVRGVPEWQVEVGEFLLGATLRAVPLVPLRV